MRRTRWILAAFLLGCPALLHRTDPAQGGPFRPGGYRGPAYARPYNGNRMPGWDWWRTYPWSPYNDGRNPYNPIVYPYPYVYTYPVYDPSAGTTYSGYAGMTPGSAALANATLQASLPYPTGPTKTPPPDAALIEVRVPDEFAEVRFDGEPTSSIGTRRYYLTPVLEAGKDYHYALKASWKKDGQTVTREQPVAVTAGQTSLVDFTKTRP